MQEKNLKELLTRYKNGKCTPEEIRQLFNELKNSDFDDTLESSLKDSFDEMLGNDANSQPATAKIVRMHPLRKVSIAAAVIILLAGGIYFFMRPGNQTSVKAPLAIHHETIQPGHSQAVLTLDNGKQFVLDSAATGKLTELSGTVVSLDNKGELAYNAGNASIDEKIVYNTVSIPTGGFFSIVLPDGSKVWLNSESELTFPSRFAANERNVRLKGEGYFEIAKDKKKPFRVNLGHDEQITVLGTVFNVMSYGNEPDEKITLLEGSIQLSDSKSKVILKPGEQAIVSDGKMEIKREISTEHETAWKNGLFDFQNDDLSHILRQIARWYNVEIENPVFANEGHYTGAIRKSSSINEVLKMLELAGNFNFSIVGKKIIVNEKK